MPCYVRNIMFIVIGFCIQPNNLFYPLLEPDTIGAQDEWARGGRAAQTDFNAAAASASSAPPPRLQNERRGRRTRLTSGPRA